MEERRSSCKDCLEINLLKKDVDIQSEKIESMMIAVEKITNKLEVVGQTLVSVNDSIMYWRKDYDELRDDIKTDMDNSRILGLKVEKVLAGEVKKSVLTMEDRAVIDFMRKIENVIDSAVFKIGVWGVIVIIGLSMYILFSKGFTGIFKM